MQKIYSSCKSYFSICPFLTNMITQKLLIQILHFFSIIRQICFFLRILPRKKMRIQIRNTYKTWILPVTFLGLRGVSESSELSSELPFLGFFFFSSSLIISEKNQNDATANYIDTGFCSVPSILLFCLLIPGVFCTVPYLWILTKERLWWPRTNWRRYQGRPIQPKKLAAKIHGVCHFWLLLWTKWKKILLRTVSDLILVLRNYN